MISTGEVEEAVLGFLTRVPLACIADRISCTGAFVLIAIEAMNTSGKAVRGLVKSRVEFLPVQIRGVF